MKLKLSSVCNKIENIGTEGENRTRTSEETGF